MSYRDQIDELKLQLDFIKKKNNELTVLLDQNENINLELETLLKEKESKIHYLEKEIDQNQKDLGFSVEIRKLQKNEIDKQTEQIRKLNTENDYFRKQNVHNLF